MPTHSKHSLLATLVPLIVTFRNHPSSSGKKYLTSTSTAIIIYKFSTSIVIVITRILFNFPVSFFFLLSIVHCHFANFPLFEIFFPPFGNNTAGCFCCCCRVLLSVRFNKCFPPLIMSHPSATADYRGHLM